MADTVNVHEAKTHLSRLLERVRRGATVTIARAGEPIARLVPIGKRPGAVGPASRVGDPITDREARLRRFLEQEAWPALAAGRARPPLTRDEEDELLGYGRSGA